MKKRFTEKYERERLVSPKKFDPRSFRIIDPGRPGHIKLIIGCPKGKWDVKKQRCKVGTLTQAIIKERGKK